MAKPSHQVRHARKDRAEAFLPDPDDGPVLTSPGGDDVEAFAEEFIASVTGADFVLEDARNEETDEEIDSARFGTWIDAPEPADDEVTAADA